MTTNHTPVGRNRLVGHDEGGLVSDRQEGCLASARGPGSDHPMTVPEDSVLILRLRENAPRLTSCPVEGHRK